MITIEQQKQGEELIKKLAHKAWENSSFKEQLVQNPVSTIESITGRPVPQNVKVVVDDQTDPSVIYLNIPAKPDYSEIELTDEQLEVVSGGEIMCVGAWIAVGAVALAAGVGVGYAINH